MAKREKNMLFERRSKEEKARITEGLKLLAQKEAEDAARMAKAIAVRDYLDKVGKNHKEIGAIREKIANIEINENTDFENVYTLLVAANNRLETILGEAPEGYPKLNQMPIAVVYCIDADASSHMMSVDTLAHNLVIHLEKNPSDIKITEYDVYSEKFEILFLVTIKKIMSKVKRVCDLLG